MDSRGSRPPRRLLHPRKVCKLNNNHLHLLQLLLHMMMMILLLQMMLKLLYCSSQTCGSDSENGVTLQTGGALPPPPHPERLLQPESRAEVCTADWGWPVRKAEGFSPAHPKNERKVSPLMVNDFLWWHHHCVLCLTCHPVLRLLQATCGAAWAPATPRAARVKSAI